MPPALRRWLPLLVILALGAGFMASGLHRYLTLEATVRYLDLLNGFIARHAVLAMLAYVSVYVAVVALSLPGALVMTILGGLLFDWLIGGALAVTGATLGAAVIFLAARTSLGATLREKAGPRLAGLAEGFRSDAASYLLFVRLVPLFPFALVNLAAATFSVPFLTFIWTTVVGILPGTFAFSLAGASLDGVVDSQREAFMACKAAGAADCRLAIDLKALVSRKLLLAFAALGVVALIPMLARRWSSRKGGAA
jgi:uncharacterized membrane protein YdjX (TVP38/TMEM64 family)